MRVRERERERERERARERVSEREQERESERARERQRVSERERERKRERRVDKRVNSYSLSAPNSRHGAPLFPLPLSGISEVSLIILNYALLCSHCTAKLPAPSAL